MRPSHRILVGHVMDRLRELPDESVHCVVTSPPYFGLRSYGTEPQVWHVFNGNPELAHPKCENGHEWSEEGKSGQRLRNGISGTLEGTSVEKSFGEPLNPSTGASCRHCNAWRGSLGLEPTLNLFLDHLVEIFREVRRVLRKDGTFWLNIGDSYNNADKWGGGGANTGKHTRKPDGSVASWEAVRRRNWSGNGFKPKDLMLVPWRLAIRLQEDGWWVRSAICWAKRAPMPESTEDRPTSAWEPVLLLTKSARYFYDNEAVKEDFATDPRENYPARAKVTGRGDQGFAEARGGDRDKSGGFPPSGSKRNMRNFWHLGPEPLSEPHFAAFPSEIPRRAILAGTSEKGVCPKCSAPWIRIVSKAEYGIKPRGDRNRGGRTDGYTTPGGGQVEWNLRIPGKTIGWKPTCSCNAGEPVSATILDPFLGAGTSLVVADRLGRNCVGIELFPKYAAMAGRRLTRDAGPFVRGDVAVEAGPVIPT